MVIKIECPACSGTGEFKPLGTPCTYCNEEKTVPLTKHLRVLNEDVKRRNVEHFQRHTKPITKA